MNLFPFNTEKYAFYHSTAVQGNAMNNNHRIIRLITSLVGLIILMTGCNINVSQPTPTASLEPVVQATDTAIPTSAPQVVAQNIQVTATVAPSNTPDVIIASPTPSPKLPPPSTTPTPTETPGPYVHVIAENETLGYIIQLYGYDYSDYVIDQVVALNPNIPNRDFLPGAGNEILIPRQTATPIPEGADITATADAQLGVTRLGDITIPQETDIDCHVVEESQTLVEIALLYNTTLEVISQLNRGEFDWTGCQFDQYSGGPRCNPIVVVGQCVQVPLPTPMPTSTPTPNGLETATPTPTYSQPSVIYPPDGATAPSGVFNLQWVSAGILREGEVYLIEVTDNTTGAKWAQVTQDTYITLPDSLIPSDGQTHFMSWYVAIARINENNRYSPISGQGNVRTFNWQSR